MGIWDKIRGEFIDIIEWLDSSSDTIVYRFERHNNEIKYGAKLTVRESQVAVFVDEGQFADVFTPGMYTLETSNLPILSTIKGWKYGFNSPFKSEVYFVNTKRFNDQKWGTKNPIMLRDADFGMVRVRAFGTYSFRITDAKLFLQEVVGTNWEFTTAQISDQLRNYVVSAFAEALSETKMPVLDLYSHYDDMGATLTRLVGTKIAAMGIELVDLMVENVSVPPEVEQAIDTRSKMGAVGNLDNYMKFQAGEAMVKGAENPSGAGAIGAQMAAGMMMGQQVAQTFNQPPSVNPAPDSPNIPTADPPPVPTSARVFIAKDGKQTGPFDISDLKAMADGGEITKDSLVWMEGLAEWKKAGEVDVVAGLFPAVPPPIPPSS